jgi:quercetin dioxygenase-like cupin family protein
MIKKARIALLATALAVAALAAGPPVVSAITATLFTVGTLEERVDVNNDRIRLKTKHPADVHVQESRFSPGDVVDWHHHPGFALIAVKSGTMTFYDPDCSAHRIGPGQAFVESGGPTKAANEGSAEALFYVTYVVPQGSPRIVFTDPPRCATGEEEADDDRDEGDGDSYGDD